MKKGVSEFVSAVLLLVISVIIASFITSWVTNISYEKSKTIQNNTNIQLQCNSGGFYIKTATYNCDLNCAAGTAHNTTVVIVNSGRISLSINKIYIQNTTGNIFTMNLNQSYSIDPGITSTFINVSTDTCNGINRTIDKIIVNSIECPNAAFDSMRGSDVTYTRC